MVERAHADPPPLVSVVMPVRNEERWIERSVRSILTQAYPPERLEVLVVVAPSRDRTREIVERLAVEDGRLKLIDNPAGIVPAALNLGVSRARGELIARVDGHTWVPGEFIATGVEVLQRTGASGVGGKGEFVGTGPVSQATALALASRAGGGGAAFRVGGAEREADTLAFGLYPREVFDRVGPFDEELVCNQDDEWHHRARLAGERFVFTPSMRFSHVARSSLPALGRQYERWGAFRVVTIAKRGRPGAARQLAPPALVATLAAALAADISTAGRRRIGRRLLMAYGAGLAGAGAYEAFRARCLQLAPLITLSLATMHLSYGAGFWTELMHRALGHSGVLGSRRER